MNQIFILLIILFSSCQLNDGRLGACGSIEASKARKVFVASYDVEDNIIIIEGIKYPVSQIWLEKVWRYDYSAPLNTLPDNIDNELQLQIMFKEETISSHYSEKWYLGIDTSLHFRPAGRKSLITTLTEMPSDTIVIPIQRTQQFNKEKQKILGELTLIRK